MQCILICMNRWVRIKFWISMSLNLIDSFTPINIPFGEFGCNYSFCLFSFMGYQIKLVIVQKSLYKKRHEMFLVINTCSKFLIDLSKKAVLFCIGICRKCYKSLTSSKVPCSWLLLCLTMIWLVSLLYNFKAT